VRVPEVDYEGLAPTYDQRFIEGSSSGKATGLLSLARALDAARILEVGCGTGHWLQVLASVAGPIYGLDLSPGMLRQARRRQVPLHLVRGRAAHLPFPGGTFDLVYCVDAIHHFGDPRTFVVEAARLLRPGGALAVVGMDPRTHRDRWYVYDYFPGTYETDLARFPAWDTVLDWMRAAGLARLERRTVERIVDHKTGRGVLADPFLRKEACSQLALLSDEAYAAGLRCVEAALDAAEARGETLTFPTDLHIAMLAGWVEG
jgi:ubiquinone/menaquinone biosynthesis C-methylase UbiE